MPFLSSEDNVIIAIKELTHAIFNPAPDSHFYNMGDATLSSISKFSEVLTTFIEKFPPKTMVPKSLPPVQTALPDLPALDQPFSVPARSISKVATKIPLVHCPVSVPVPVQAQPTASVPNSFNIIEDNKRNVPDISYNMPYPKSNPNIVTADTTSSPRVPRYKLRPHKNLFYTGGISTWYNLAINLIQTIEANSVIHPITGVPQE